jgi:Cu2+-exporting ATPase
LSLEKPSNHPLAKAVVGFAKDKSSLPVVVSNFRAVAGRGVEGTVDGDIVRGGTCEFIEELISIPQDVNKTIRSLADQGKTPMVFAKGNRLLGVMAVSDSLKDDSPAAISELKNMGLRIVMLTGDNRRTAETIGASAGIDEIIAEVLPDGKASVISELKKQGRVIMVGDGINDAPALAVADVGIAIGAGTDVAIDVADVVLMKSRLSDLSIAIKLSRATLRNIHQNLFWAFFYNSIGIPLAAGVWIPIFGWELDPMFGALAMSLSSFCVVMNALRLNLVNITRPTKIKTNKKSSTRPETACAETKGGKNIMKIMKIEGMMCPHCSGRVKKCLEAIEGVENAEVSHESGTAIVTLSTEDSNEVLKKTVEDAGYDVTEIV